MAVVMGAVSAAAAEPAATIENLNEAFNGESNAQTRYLAFAKKADEEGFGQAASLFRAAASAEKVHLTAHAEVLKALGATAKADIKAPEVKSTPENLEAAMKGEMYERDTMYPKFIAQAKKDTCKEAEKGFTHAGSAEGIHANLYKEMIAEVAKGKAPKREFFVCPECGNIVTELTFTNCPICKEPKKKFMKTA
jgi:rubrerythrin